LLMTEPLVHRVMPGLMLAVLVSIGAFAQSDSTPRPMAPPAPATDGQAGDKSDKSGEGSRAGHSDSAYVIGANDVLAINVWKEPDISRSVRVRSDGKISLPLGRPLPVRRQRTRQAE